MATRGVGALRRLEARGEVVGGRFVLGLSGQQYATLDAASMLADRREGRSGRTVTLAGSDPINLTGNGAAGPPRARGAAPTRDRRGGRRRRRRG